MLNKVSNFNVIIKVCVFCALYVCSMTTLIETDFVNAEEKVAGHDDGVNLNQAFIALEDGTFYATRDRKVLKMGIVLDPHESAIFRRQVITRLNYYRYWSDGAVPKRNALERHLARKEKAEQQQAFSEMISKENWFRAGFYEKPHAHGSEGSGTP